MTRRSAFGAAVLLFATTAALPGTVGAREPPRAIRWLHDEAAARAAARRAGKPLLIDFRADWCSACKMLDRLTWSDSAVRSEVAARYVPLQIDVTEEDDAANERAKRYGVSSLPTVLVNGRRITGFVGPREMAEALRAEGRATAGSGSGRSR